jgi:ubiquinone/menaquinone biosynthesis C-methylase UbiE
VDEFFDLVIPYSVFTHLTREVQKAWLAEMRRVIAPGGLLIASVHGQFAASFAFPQTVFRRFMPRIWNRFLLPATLRRGISDTILDHALDGIAPEGYYRGVFPASTPSGSGHGFSRSWSTSNAA